MKQDGLEDAIDERIPIVRCSSQMSILDLPVTERSEALERRLERPRTIRILSPFIPRDIRRIWPVVYTCRYDPVFLLLLELDVNPQHRGVQIFRNPFIQSNVPGM